MPNMDFGPRGSEIVRRFFNGAKDTRQHAHKQKQWSVSLAPGPHLFTDWRHILAAEVSGGFTWVMRETGEPVRVIDEHGEYTTGPIDAVMVPYDVPEGIRISVCKAERSDPVPHHEPPGQVRHSQGCYRTWYRPIPLGAPYSSLLEGGVFHAESDDGYSWKNRRECTFDTADCPDVEARGPFPGIFEDPSAPDSERFKMVFQGRSTRPEFARHRQEVLHEFIQNYPEGIDPTALSFDGPDGTPLIQIARYGAVSPDGLHWRVLRQPLMIIYSDAENVVYYDTNRQSYLWFLKTQWYDGRRSIGRAETRDFRHWPLADTIIHPGADLHPSDDWYTNSKTLYPGTTDHHFLFPALYHHADDSSDIHAFSSVDTVSWTRIPGGPILPADDPRSWDAGFVTASVDLVPLPGGKVGLPYGGARYPHKYPRNRHTWDAMKRAYALWPKERITAVIADEAGRFTTLPLLFDGRRLRLNYRTTQGGEIRVEAAESRRSGGHSKVLPGRSFADCVPLAGDETDRTVAWKNGEDLGHRDGQPVTLRFRMRSASLFAFELIAGPYRYGSE